MAINYVISYTFSPSTVISSAEVNKNFSDNSNTWSGIEAMTKTLAHLKMDADPGTALEVATKQYVDNSLSASLSTPVKNFLLNGEMRFDQRKEGGSYSSSDHSAKHSLDQWRFEGTGTPEYTINRDALVMPSGFTNSLKVTVTTGGAPGASDGCNLEYPCEPSVQKNWQWGSANATAVTLSFYVLSTQTGTYSVSLLNGVDSRSYVSTYTIDTINTWKRITVTVPGDTSAAADWPTTGVVYGLKVVWDFGSGSAVTTSTLNAWQAGAYWKATGSANVVQTAPTGWYMTGVQLELGSSATGFEFSPDDVMLQKLQRYYWKSMPIGTAAIQAQGALGSITYVCSAAGISANGAQIQFPVNMFQTPTMTAFNPGSSNTKWYNQNRGADSGSSSFQNQGAGGAFVVNSQSGADLAQQACTIHVSANARLGDVA